MKYLQLFVLFSTFLFIFSFRAFAVPPPASQQAGGQQGLSEQQERENQLREKVEQPLPKAENQEPVPAGHQPLPANNEKTLINKINVSGNTIFPAFIIKMIVKPYEKKELSVSDMQKVADLITDEYRKNGFITTRAIIPPQKVINNILEIRVVQGLMGNLDVKGNRYFKKFLYTREVTLKKGEPFNYNKLLSNLYNINQYPDRNVKTVLTPGQNPGETDVLFNVKDQLPIHVGFSYDNFGSKYLGQNRVLGTVTDNNLLGLGDILTFQYQDATVKDAYKLESFRYLFPITSLTQFGFYSTENQIKLQGDLKDTLARGKSDVYGVFVNQTIVNQPNLKIVADTGFDYKDVHNFLLDIESSRDLERVAKAGFNIDYSDPWYGRSIVNEEVDFGIPDIMGGSRAVDPHSSIVGAGGRFTKDVFDYLRLQSLPLDTNLLLKTEVQFSGNDLDSTEQYQLGGISNVRGFAPGEAVGDSGQTFTAEFGIPFYGIPRTLSVPFSTAKLYDALKFAAFYDWGHVNLRDPQPGEIKDRILDSFGCGLRLNLPEDLSMRLDFAWPDTGRPSDGQHEHTWVQVTKQF